MDAKPIKHRPAHEIVLRALEIGQDVALPINGVDERCTIRMVDGVVVMVGRSYSPGEDFTDPKAGREKFLGIDDFVSLNGFISMCKDIPELELVRISAQTVLMSEHRRRPRVLKEIPEENADVSHS